MLGFRSACRAKFFTYRLGSKGLTSICVLISMPLMGIVSGCSKSHSNLSKDCGVSEDQKSSFTRRVDAVPIQMTADDQFTDLERDSILATTREWNRSARSLIGSDLFIVRFGSIPSG